MCFVNTILFALGNVISFTAGQISGVKGVQKELIAKDFQVLIYYKHTALTPTINVSPQIDGWMNKERDERSE